MSKSKGNVISALDILDQYGDNAVRFHFLKDGPLERDEVFSASQLVDNHNAHLVNEFSNSVYRVSNSRFLPPPGTPFTLPALKTKREADFITSFNSKAETVYKTTMKGSLQTVIGLIQQTNQYLNASEFWTAKNKQEQHTIIATASEALRVISVLLYPVVPSYSELLLKYFRVQEKDRVLDKCRIEAGRSVEIRYDWSVRDKLFMRKLRCGDN
eukprot:TRINITY_DN3118_c0_g2_i2.p1 TRINITY_DN3118_c0_g2~~TRINITY_DN3118_c0_g2_i2.p1  ORF type:complete len:213 (-),score=60.24 TRINITY_DN3118_c0_g2_i2:122-760(-)